MGAVESSNTPVPRSLYSTVLRNFNLSREKRISAKENVIRLGFFFVKWPQSFIEHIWNARLLEHLT